MSRFNKFMDSHFSNCRLLACAYDHCRNRNVTVHQIPGEVECVGVSDGVDAWIAPTIANPFSFDLIKLFKDIADGIQVKLPLISPMLAKTEGSKPRRALLIEEVETNPPPRTRKPLLLDPGAKQPVVRRQLNFN